MGMRPILARSHRPLLERLAGRETLIGLDFDGTLAPIVADPAAARLPASTRTLLTELATRLPCVVISGRSRDDVCRRLRGVAIAEVFGNHGLEPCRASGRMARQVAGWRRTLERSLEGFPGVLIEDKRFSLSVHFRHARRKAAVVAAVGAALQRLEHVRLVPGKQVLNLVPSYAPHKGHALEHARTLFDRDTVLYVGDDDTDEDVFRSARGSKGFVGVRVGRGPRSAAEYFLRDQTQVDSLLRMLVVGTRRGRTRITAASAPGDEPSP